LERLYKGAYSISFGTLSLRGLISQEKIRSIVVKKEEKYSEDLEGKKKEEYMFLGSISLTCVNI